MWTIKNVGGDQSKYLKMQKLLIVQILSLLRTLTKNESDYDIVTSDDSMMALNFRLI